MFNVKVQISGDKEVMRKLEEMSIGLKDWKPELLLVGNFAKNYFENTVFETEGGIFGQRWAPLKNEVAKRSAFPGRGILERTGHMRHNWQMEASATEIRLGNDTSYAEFHQLGTRNMVARPLMVIDTLFKNQISDIFKEGLAVKLGVIFGV